MEDGRMVTDERTAPFAALYDGLRSSLVAYALRRTGSAEDAADAIAETFEIAWVRLEAIPEGPPAVLWLYVTCRNVIANHHRRIKRRSDVLERLVDSLAPAFATRIFPSDSDRLEAAAALSLLSEDDREILMLAGWEGLNTR